MRSISVWSPVSASSAACCEIEHALLELAVAQRGGPPSDGHDARPGVSGEQLLEHVAADETGSAGEERGAAHDREK